MIVAALALSAAALISALALLVAVKRELWQRDSNAREQLRAAAAEAAAVRADMDALRTRFEELEERTGMLSVPLPVRSGLNISRRAQAIRLLRRGDSPEQVAAGIGVPAAEARLLAAIERIRGLDSNRAAPVQ